MRLLLSIFIFSLSVSGMAADKWSHKLTVEAGEYDSYSEAITQCNANSDQVRQGMVQATSNLGTTSGSLSVSESVMDQCTPVNGHQCYETFVCYLQLESQDSSIGFATVAGPTQKGKGNLDRCHQDELAMQKEANILLTGISGWRILFSTYCAAYGIEVGKM